jgi:hypothetical protein
MGCSLTAESSPDQLILVEETLAGSTDPDECRGG